MGKIPNLPPTEILIESPHHPYTQALINAVPDFTQPLGFKTKLGTLEGTVPILEQMPIGCRLGPRCPFAQKKMYGKTKTIENKTTRIFLSLSY